MRIVLRRGCLSLVALLISAPSSFAQRPNIQWMRGGFSGGGDNGDLVTPTYSGDGQHLFAWGYSGGSAKIFDVSTGLLLKTVVPFEGNAVQAASLSPDSEVFAVSGQDTSGPAVKIYGFPSGNLLHTIATPVPANPLSFSPNHSLLAVAYGNNTSPGAGYFKIATGAFTPATLLVNGIGPPQNIQGYLQFLGDGIAVATFNCGNLWTGVATFPWTSYIDYGEGSGDFPMSSVGSYIANSLGTVYTALSGTTSSSGQTCGSGPRPAFAPPYGTSASLSPDGAVFAVAFRSGTLQTFATGSWVPGPSITLPGGTSSEAYIGFSPDSQSIALGDPLIQILRASDLSVESTVAFDWDQVSSVAYSPDGTFVVSGDFDGQAIVWNAANGSFQYLLQAGVLGTYTPATSVAVSPNGKLIAVAIDNTGAMGGLINVYGASTGVQTISIPASVQPNQSYFNIGFLNNSEIVASGLLGSPNIAVYSAVTGAQVQAIANPCSGGPYTYGASLFPNGKSIAVSCFLSAFAVNIHTGGATALALLPSGTGIAAMAVSPNSKYIAIGLDDYDDPPSVGRVLVFSATSGALLHTYVGSKSSAWSVAFSSDSQTVVAGSSNGLLDFWDLTSQKLLQSYNQETGDVNGSVCNCPNVSAIAYSSDNKYVYYGRNDGSSVLISNPVYFPIASLGLSAGSVIGGTSVTGTVTLAVPAPSYGAKVLLTSSDSAAADVPASVKIPAGQTSATFTITTTSQTAPTGVTITANSTGTVQTASLTVLPQPELTAITLSPTSVTGGGPTTNNTLTLNSAAPTGGVTVTLSSSNTAVAVTPASVVVPAGATVSPAFTITTSPVTAQTGVTISAAYNGITKQATLTVN